MSESSPVQIGKPLLSDQNYNRLKKSATIILPALAALYIALAQIWNFPKVEEVAGSIAALNTFLGLTIQISKRSYYANGNNYVGDLMVEDHPQDSSQKIIVAHLNGNAEDISDKDEVTFRVSNDTGNNQIPKM